MEAIAEIVTEEDQGRCCCLDGWVFIGSIDNDGEEIVESYACRRCGGGVAPAS